MARKTKQPVKRTPVRKTKRPKKSTKWSPFRPPRRRFWLFLIPFVLVGAYFIIKTFAYGNTAVANGCNTKSCVTSSGHIWDQNHHPISGVTLTDCNNHFVTTASDGYYAFRLPKGTGYCTRLVSVPAGYGAPYYADDSPLVNHPPASYEWQIIGAACHANPTYCGPNGIAYKTSSIVLSDDVVGPETQLDFRIKTLTPLPVSPGCSIGAYPSPGQYSLGHLLDYNYLTPTQSELKQTISFTNNPGYANNLAYTLTGHINGNVHQLSLEVDTSDLIQFRHFFLGQTTPPSLDDIRTAPGATKSIYTVGNVPIASINYNAFYFAAGSYTLHIKRGEFDGVGDWWNGYVTFPGKAERYIGGLRVRRAQTGVATILQNLQSYTTWPGTNLSAPPYPVPYWQLNAALPIGDNGLTPQSVSLSFPTLPDVDGYYYPPTHEFRLTMGGDTSLCHQTSTWQIQ